MQFVNDSSAVTPWNVILFLFPASYAAENSWQDFRRTSVHNDKLERLPCFWKQPLPCVKLHHNFPELVVQACMGGHCRMAFLRFFMKHHMYRPWLHEWTVKPLLISTLMFRCKKELLCNCCRFDCNIFWSSAVTGVATDMLKTDSVWNWIGTTT